MICTTTATTPGLYRFTGVRNTLAAIWVVVNASVRVTEPPPPDFSLTISPVSGSVVQGTSKTYTLTLSPLHGFSSSVSLGVTGLDSGTTGSFFNSVISPSQPTSFLTVNTSRSTSLATDGFSVVGAGGGLSRTAYASFTVLPRQPTSLSFGAPSGYAGNDCYTMTVGNGESMEVSFLYKRNGVTQPEVSIMMDSAGQFHYCSTHDDSGTYEFDGIRNILISDYVTLNPAVSYTFLPPQPTSLSVAPTSIQAGSGSYSMTVGNGANTTLDYRFRFDGGATQTVYGWPSLAPVSPGSSTGRADIGVGVCTAPGTYSFTSLRNTLNSPWVAVSQAITVTPPSGPAVASLSVSSAAPGTSVDLDIVGSNLCGVGLASSVGGITFSNLSYDNSTGASAHARVNVGSNTPVGSATVTLTANGGSTTFGFQVQGPTGEPVVNSVSPQLILHGNRTITLYGANLRYADFALVTTPADPTDSPRYFPGISFNSVDPNGAWLKLNVNATDTRILDFHRIQVSNQFGVDEALFRVVPVGPLVDAWTPPNPVRGQVYALSMVGLHLQNTTVVPADSSRAAVYSVDSSSSNRVNGILQIPAGAPTGDTHLIVRDSSNREWRVPIRIEAEVAPKGKNLTTGMSEMPALYLQDHQFREPTSGDLEDLLFYIEFVFNIADFHWQVPLVYCPSLDRYGDRCLVDLYPGQSIDLYAAVLSVWLHVDIRVTWVIFPPTYPYGCVEAGIAAEIPGTTGGLARFYSRCTGRETVSSTVGNTASIQFGGGGACLQVTRIPTGLPYFDGARVTRLGCCSDPVYVSASGTSFYQQVVEGRNISTSFNFNRLVAMPAPPPACYVEPMFIGPPVVTLKNGGTKQLTLRDSACNVIPGPFPSGTTTAIGGLYAGQPTTGVATISSQGLLTGGASPAAVSANVELPGESSPLTGCATGAPPIVQVVPMTIYLNFPAETIAYMKDGNAARGLGLRDNEVDQVQNLAAARVQDLFNAAGANLVVVRQAPPQLGVPIPPGSDQTRPTPNEDGVIVILVVPERDTQGAILPTRRWNDSGTATVGRSGINELNWVNALFGLDTEGFTPTLTPKPTGVFINRLPLINPNTNLRVSVTEIGNAIGNIAAHEAAHAMGAVPDVNAKGLRDALFDDRLNGVTFNQTAGDRHSPNNNSDVMAPETTSTTSGPPAVLGTGASFRAQVATYLRAILPL